MLGDSAVGGNQADITAGWYTASEIKEAPTELQYISEGSIFRQWSQSWESYGTKAGPSAQLVHPDQESI